MRLYSIVENIFEDDNQEPSGDSAASKEAREKNLVHLGRGVYASKAGGEPEYRSVDGGKRLEKIQPQQQKDKSIKSNTFDRNMARLRNVPADQIKGGADAKKNAERRLLKKWSNHLTKKAAERGEDWNKQFTDTTDFPGGPEAYRQMMDRIAQKYGEIPNWDDVSARSEIPDTDGGSSSLSDMIPGYEPETPSTPMDTPTDWPTPVAQTPEPASPSPATPAPAATPAPTPATPEPTSPSYGSPALDKMVQHFGGDLAKVKDTLQKRIDFHTQNPSPDSQAKIDAARELISKIDPQSSVAPTAPEAPPAIATPPAQTNPTMLSPMVPTQDTPTQNIDPVPTPAPSGDISIDPAATKAAQKQLMSAGGDYDAARSQLAKRVSKAQTPEEKKKIAQIAQALTKLEKDAEAEISGFADKIKQAQQAQVNKSRDKYALARNNPNKGL